MKINVSNALALCGLVLSTGCNSCGGSHDTELTVINNDPIADAGPDISQNADENVTLDGSGSYDPDGHPLTYHWGFERVPAGSTLLEAEHPFGNNHGSSSQTTFMPDVAGTYVVTLVVSDTEGGESLPDSAIVTISEGVLPVADAGPDQVGVEGQTFQLNGSGSYDLMGRDLTYSWTFAQVPAASTGVTLNNSSTVEPSFTADVGGLYIVGLVVNNGLSESIPDTMLVTVSSADPAPPVAVTGPDVEGVDDCTFLSVTGEDSYDPNGDPLTYLWDVQIVPAGSAVTADSFEDRTAETTRFFPDVAGEYLISLAVNDGTSWSAPDLQSISVTERSYNTAPDVDAGADRAFDGGETECVESGYAYACDACDAMTVTLGGDAVVTDADGDPYTVSWEVTSGDATIADPSELTTTVTLEGAEPTEPGMCEDTEYVFLLTVTDCTGESVQDTVTFVVTCCGAGGDSGASPER